MSFERKVTPSLRYAAGLAAIALSACAVPPVEEAKACEVLTITEINRATGAAFIEGRPSGTGDSCQFGDPDGDRSVLVSLVEGDTAESFAEARRNSAASGGATRDFPGTGDEAFVQSAPSGEVHSAEARTGSTRVRLLVSGPGSTAHQATTLLTTALERMTVR